MAMRKRISVDTKVALLTESGYRCGNPSCRNVLALDFHHIVQVQEGGSNDPSNLLPLCGFCHDLYHRGTILPESIRAWKVIAISLSKAFDKKAIDVLLTLFSRIGEKIGIYVSGEGLLEHASLIASGLVTVGDWGITYLPGVSAYYELKLTEKGVLFIQGWKNGDLLTLDNIEALKEKSKVFEKL